MDSFDRMVAEYARKLGDAEYVYGSITDCALCQFLRANDMAKNPRAGGSGWKDDRGRWNGITPALEQALVSEPHNFLALADRLETSHA